MTTMRRDGQRLGERVPSVWVAVPIGMAVGVAAAFSGFSGGFILVPILLAFAFLPVRAVGTAFVAVLAISVSALAAHSHLAHVVPITGLMLGLGGLVGAQIGARIVKHIPSTPFKLAFSVLLLGIAILLVGQALGPTLPTPHEAGINGEALDALALPTAAGLIGAGGGIGIVGSCAGLGGGFLFVPLLMGLGLDHTMAVGTSFVATLIVSTSALIAHARQRAVHVRTGVALGIGGVFGSQIGAHFVAEVSRPMFQIIFAVVLVLIATQLVIATRKRADAAAQRATPKTGP